MEWLNYHHLRYFWAVAREGNLRGAAAKLHVSQPSISAQIKELEAALGEPLFRRSGRRNVLTDAGQIAFRYAEELFALGSELVNAVQQRPGGRRLRLHLGVADSVPKLITYQIIKPVLEMPQAVRVICREGKVEDLLGQLAAHRLDLVLADEPAPSSLRIRAFSHLLGQCDVTFCAAPALARQLRRGFPKSLQQAPGLLPVENTALRRSLEQWFLDHKVQPRVVAEFEDSAVMNVIAADGRGFIPVPTAVLAEARERYNLQVIGVAKDCLDAYYAISVERRIRHPAVALITDNAKRLLSAK